MNRFAPLEAVLRDARYALRVLLRAPAFSLTAVATLAMAIAVNTAVFSVVDAVLLKPLPYPDPARLALVTSVQSAGGVTTETTAQNGLTWETIRDHAGASDTAVYSGWTTGVNLVANGGASYVQQQRVGAGFFAVLGVRPLLGREFDAAEDREGGPPAAILSHALWTSTFGARPDVVGAAIELRGERATVVGVMPEGFRTGEKADVWTPLRPSVTGQGAGENYAVLARLRPGVSWAAARGDMQRAGAEVLRRRGAAAGPPSFTLSLQPLQESLAADMRQPLLMLWAAVGIVLLIASVNLAGLLLARGSGRAREIATRMAVGSGRAGVIRQLVVESVVLAVIGGAAGIGLGVLALEGLKALAAGSFDIWRPVALDGRAAAVASLLALGASIVFGLAPAFQATRLDVQAAMRSGGTRAVAGGSSRWPRQALVVAQVALGVVLLVGAGLLVRTFAHLRGLEPGFDPARVTTATISLEDARYQSAAAVSRLFEQTLGELDRLPGIDNAAVVLGLPYERLLNLGFRHLTGPAAAAESGRMTNAAYISGDLFGAMGIPVRAGRTFTAADTAAAPGVAIVNEAFAAQYFEGASPIGHRVRLAGGEREIVGVVGNVQVRPGWGSNGPIAAMPLAYIPLAQANDALLRLVHGWFSPAFVVRSSGGTEAAAGAIRRALDAADPLLPFARVRSMEDVRGEALARQRFLMALLAGLALVAVVLAAVGIHGLIATSVVERTREMGIRLALGATRGRAVRTLVAPGLMLALAGTAIGAASALAFGRLLRSFVWGVSPTDPLTFAAVSGILLGVAGVASVLPALRILRVDPAITLRND